jgi:hypothetical protein
MIAVATQSLCANFLCYQKPISALSHELLECLFPVKIQLYPPSFQHLDWLAQGLRLRRFEIVKLPMAQSGHLYLGCTYLSSIP